MKLNYGPAMYQLLGIVAAGEGMKITNISALARSIVGEHGKHITRQRAMQLINLAVQDGLLNERPVPYNPNMIRR